jgi:hypothetical protein
MATAPARADEGSVLPPVCVSEPCTPRSLQPEPYAVGCPAHAPKLLAEPPLAPAAIAGGVGPSGGAQGPQQAATQQQQQQQQPQAVGVLQEHPQLPVLRCRTTRAHRQPGDTGERGRVWCCTRMLPVSWLLAAPRAPSTPRVAMHHARHAHARPRRHAWWRRRRHGARGRRQHPRVPLGRRSREPLPHGQLPGARWRR